MCSATWQTKVELRQRVRLRLELTFEAGSDIRAPASSASSLPKTGAPNPFGQLRTMQVTSPPQESPFFRMSSMTAVTLMFARNYFGTIFQQHAYLCTSAQPHLCLGTSQHYFQSAQR